MNLISVRNLTITVRQQVLLRNLDLDIEAGRCCLVTSSVAGVHFLKAVAGFATHESLEGSVFFQGEDLYAAGEKRIKELKRRIAYVFSEGTMISNLTVAENLELPVRFHHPEMDAAALKETIRRKLDDFELPDVLKYRPAQLSYYVLKKLAFIRAVLLDPCLILLDKPMFNLENKDSEQVLAFLADLKRKGVTLVMVSQFSSLMEPLIDVTIDIKGNEETGHLPADSTSFLHLPRSG